MDQVSPDDLGTAERVVVGKEATEALKWLQLKAVPRALTVRSYGARLSSASAVTPSPPRSPFAPSRRKGSSSGRLGSRNAD